MKVAFVIPFAFERFFNDSRELFKYPEKFEDEVISARNTWHFNWCNALKSAGIDVVMFHISRNAVNVREYKHYTGVRIIRVPASFRTISSRNEISFSLLNQVRKFKPDIVFSVTHILTSTIDMFDLLVIYSRLMGLKVVTRNPGAKSYDLIFYRSSVLCAKLKNLKENRSPGLPLIKCWIKYVISTFTGHFKFIIKKKCLRLSHLLIPQTPGDLEELVSKFKIRPGRVSLLPKPVDINNFREIPREAALKNAGLDPNFRYLLYVSNLYSTKGCEHIIGILPELIKKYENIKLLIAGGGQSKEYLETLVKNKHLGNHVIFTGQIEHQKLVYYYNSSSVFVLPTDRVINEGIPNVILEAIACNVPPVSTSIPGLKALINDDLGILVEMLNNQELVKAINRVLDGEFQINPSARSQFLKEYSIEGTGRRLNASFEMILQENN